MKRRAFLQGSAAGISSLATGLGIEGSKPALAVEQTGSPAGADVDQIGRPVRVVSIGFPPHLPLEQIAAMVDAEGARGADLIAIPETCRGQNDASTETLDGPTVSAMAQLARKHRTYVVCPIDRKDGARRFNSAVLLDRDGRVVSIYNKLYPVWKAECLQTNPVLPGDAAPVYHADFGRVGMAICFDVNWGALWQRFANLGAELIIWPSAYSAGRSLQAQAINYHYYIVSATHVPDCLVFDIDGEQLVHDHNNRGDRTNVTRVTLDLDRCIFHQDLNIPEKRDKLLKEHGEDVAQEKWLAMEGWFVLKARRPGVSARELARQYDLEELRHYLNRSQCEIDKCRGFEFA